MPQMTNMVLKDHSSADHTFEPESVRDNVATFVESAGVPIGNRRLSYSVNRTPNGRYKVTIKGVFPTVATETINGVGNPKILRTAYADVSLAFDASSSELERLDVLHFVAGLLVDNGPIHDASAKLQSMY